MRDYFKIIGRHRTAFVVIIILTTLFAFGFTLTRPTTYTASTTFTVNKGTSLEQAKIDYYLFDNYYNIQSAGLYSQIVALWFESPALVTEIYQKAGIELPNISQKALGKTFKAVREEPAIINVSISGNDQEKLNKLMSVAYEVMQAKTNELGKKDASYYELAKFEPISTKNESNLLLNTFIGLLAGILLGILVAMAIEYFKVDDRK